MATRHKGIIAEWHTARGFGFIEPDTGHIEGDERQRLRAARVIQAGATIPQSAKAPAAKAEKLNRSLIVRGLSLLALIVLAALVWLAITRLRR